MTTRTPKTPQQRASEALATEQRKLKRFTTGRDQAKAKYEQLDQLVTATTKRVEHLAGHPDLPPQPAPATRRGRARTDPPALTPSAGEQAD